MKKEKYKLKTKIGQKVYRIILNLPNGDGRGLYEKGLFVDEYKIVFQSEYRIALNDNWITLLDRQKKERRKELLIN